MECTNDEDCPIGYHCGGDGECTADCTPTGGQCRDNEECSNRGYCESIADAGDCPSVELNFTRVTPTVVLVIDGSGSMDEDFSGVRRWDAVKTALTDPTNGVLVELQNFVVFGSAVYTSAEAPEGDDDEPTPDDGPSPDCVQFTPQASPHVPSLNNPSLNNAAAIGASLATDPPGGSTPTAEALAGVRTQFIPVAAEGPKVVVLATDGDPDTCALPNTNGQQGPRNMSVAETQTTYTAGIETYVLSVGADADQAGLQRVANAGVGKDPDDVANPAPLYLANNQAQLTAAFDAIIGGVRTCVLPIDGGTVDPNRVCEGTVTLNGSVLACGTDWQLLADNATLELLGAACDTFLDDDDVALTAEFPCGVFVE